MSDSDVDPSIIPIKDYNKFKNDYEMLETEVARRVAENEKLKIDLEEARKECENLKLDKEEVVKLRQENEQLKERLSTCAKRAKSSENCCNLNQDLVLKFGSFSDLEDLQALLNGSTECSFTLVDVQQLPPQVHIGYYEVLLFSNNHK